MTDKLKQSTKILHRPKVKTDERGRTVWVDPVETAKLELVSTQMLQHIIEADDHGTKDQLREVAEGKDGLLARDIDKDRFEIISDEELQHILDGTKMESEAKNVAGNIDEPLVESISDEAELELVSTRMLRTILDPQDEEQAAAEGSGEPGFDPYNKG